MPGNGQTDRLTRQHRETHGEVGIFGDRAREHDSLVAQASYEAALRLKEEFPQLQLSYRRTLSKKEINEALQKIDAELGQTLFLENASIEPDGGLVEVIDDHGDSRVILVSEAKYQGKDIENIKEGILVGKNHDQILMAAGNAIERAHKNICEIANYMLGESHFPYILFLEGSNFLTQNVVITRRDGSTYELQYNSGTLNRLDRLTAANYGMPLNTNLCQNKFIEAQGNSIMLQAASIYTKGTGEAWDKDEMIDIMLDVARTSLRCLARDLFDQLTNTNNE